MEKDLAATATTTIDAPASDVWDALVNPEKIKQYMFGTNVVSDFKEGSPITWKGEWKGKPYEDKGVIKRATPGQLAARTEEIADQTPFVVALECLENLLDAGQDRPAFGKLPLRVMKLVLGVPPKKNAVLFAPSVQCGGSQRELLFEVLPCPSTPFSLLQSSN